MVQCRQNIKVASIVLGTCVSPSQASLFQDGNLCLTEPSEPLSGCSGKKKLATIHSEGELREAENHRLAWYAFKVHSEGELRGAENHRQVILTYVYIILLLFLT